MSKRVYITGIGIISAIGTNVRETLQSLMDGKSGIGDITRLKTLHKGIIPMAEVKRSTDLLLEDAGHRRTKFHTYCVAWNESCP
jgi:3-oxoacyl-[acyl-carrier-protein] synthase-1